MQKCVSELVNTQVVSFYVEKIVSNLQVTQGQRRMKWCTTLIIWFIQTFSGVRNKDFQYHKLVTKGSTHQRCSPKITLRCNAILSQKLLDNGFKSEPGCMMDGEVL